CSGRAARELLPEGEERLGEGGRIALVILGEDRIVADQLVPGLLVTGGALRFGELLPPGLERRVGRRFQLGPGLLLPPALLRAGRQLPLLLCLKPAGRGGPALLDGPAK